MAKKINESVETGTIELTETESIAFQSLTEQQQELQQQAMAIQQRLVKISQEVFNSRGVDISEVSNPVLSDDKKSISYELTPNTEKHTEKQDKGTGEK